MLPLATIFDWVQTRMGQAGYPVLFGLLLACGLIPIPEDIPLFFAGYFVADGKMDLVVASICAWCGIIGGDCILYYLGYRFGRGITKVPIIGRHIDEGRIDWAHERFEKYGVWVVAIGRLFAGVRAAMVVTAGTIRFTFSHFLIADGVAALFSGGLFIALGYYGRVKFGDPHQLEAEIEHYKRLVFLVVLSGVVIWGSWYYFKSKQRSKKKQDVIDRGVAREAASKAE